VQFVEHPLAGDKPVAHRQAPDLGLEIHGVRIALELCEHLRGVRVKQRGQGFPLAIRFGLEMALEAGNDVRQAGQCRRVMCVCDLGFAGNDHLNSPTFERRCEFEEVERCGANSGGIKR
jgi:hypothetical protein